MVPLPSKPVPMPNLIEQKAISVAKRYLRNRGYAVEDVTRNREHRGYELVATKGDEALKIEVKGCTRPWGIPDPYVTEFDEEKRLVADFLYVVYFIRKRDPKLCTIPRDAINPEYVTPKHGFRISARFKKESALKPFIKYP